MVEAAADSTEQRDLAHDRLGLKAFKAYCAANKQSRALEVASSLRGVKALEGESSGQEVAIFWWPTALTCLACMYAC